MSPTPLPHNEEQRLKDLLYYNILDTPEEKDFDGLTDLAAQICGCSFAMIGFIDKDRQWMKSSHLPVKEVPRDISFCTHAILKHEVMVVNDVSKDERFFDNPIAIKMKVAFYAGAPIISENGYALGTVCVIDNQPKNLFTLRQKEGLKIIAAQISKLLELRIKNKLILEKTGLLIASEKKIAQITLTNHEKEKSFIASELHENFAQTLVGIKLYLEFAEQSGIMYKEFLQKGKENVIALIKEIKHLTKKITPTTVENDNYTEIIHELVDQFGKANSLNVDFYCNKNLDGFNTHIGLAIYRIIENQLKAALSTGAENIAIRIDIERSIKLLLKDDGNPVLSTFEDKDLLFNNTLTRTEILNGKLLRHIHTKGNNILEIEIPFGESFVSPVLISGKINY